MSYYDSSNRVNDFMARVKGKGFANGPSSEPPSGLIGTNPMKSSNGFAAADDPLDTQPEASPSTSADKSYSSRPENEEAVFVAGANILPDTEDEKSMVVAIGTETRRTLQDSKHAIQYPVKGPQDKRFNGRNLLDVEPASVPMTPTQIELLSKKGHPQFDTSAGKSTMASTTKAFANNPSPQADTDKEAFPVFNETNGPNPLYLTATSESQIHSFQQDESLISNNTVQDSQVMPQSATGTPASSPMAPDFKPSISIASPTISPIPINVHREASIEPLNADSDALQHATNILAGKIADVEVSIKEDSKDKMTESIAGEGQSREHATFFSAWGTPEARHKPKSRTRKVVLSGLPSNADYTFVQALVHGGSLESITLSPSGNSAYVLFTTGDACDDYANRYPNGISLKHKGRSLTMFVDKGKDVDVISGMLEAYLGAGASRVVRATNADEDWSMRALHRIAEGDNKRRKVESISDEFRNETRTVIFRFANIPDAVAFRGSLKRDPEWETADIQFIADPCEKASGFHFG